MFILRLFYKNHAGWLWKHFVGCLFWTTVLSVAAIGGKSLLFNKVAGRPATFLKRRLMHRCFPVNFAKFLRTPFLQNTSGWLLLYYSLFKLSPTFLWSNHLKMPLKKVVEMFEDTTVGEFSFIFSLANPFFDFFLKLGEELFLRIPTIKISVLFTFWST